MMRFLKPEILARLERYNEKLLELEQEISDPRIFRDRITSQYKQLNAQFRKKLHILPYLQDVGSIDVNFEKLMRLYSKKTQLLQDADQRIATIKTGSLKKHIEALLPQVIFQNCIQTLKKQYEAYFDIIKDVVKADSAKLAKDRLFLNTSLDYEYLFHIPELNIPKELLENDLAQQVIEKRESIENQCNHYIQLFDDYYEKYPKEAQEPKTRQP